MTTGLILVRHAVTETTGKRLSGNTPGIHLSGDGAAQAAELAERLATVPLAAIYSSPLERCMETAVAIAAGRTATVRPAADLREVEYGRWTGRPLAQLARTSMWKQVQRFPSAVRFPGGETLREVQQRSVSALEAAAAAHPRSLVAAVTHGDVIRLVLAHYAGVHLDLFQRLVVSCASVSVVVVGEHGVRILRVNDTGTLADLAPPARAPRRSAARRPTPSRPGHRMK
jgi:probable phosphomutase (TIGR03848 family)